LVNQVLSTSLCRGIGAWLNMIIDTNDWFIDEQGDKYFKDVVSYYRRDNPTFQSTSLCVYPSNSNTVNQIWYENGIIKIDFNFNIGKTRETIWFEFLETTEALRANMVGSPEDMQTFLSKDYTPGLLWISSQNKTDMSRLLQQVEQGTYGMNTITLEVQYRISIILNQKSMRQKGYDYYSPYRQVYQPIQGYDIDISLQQKIGNVNDNRF
jgi:hypothetical protein